MDRIRNTALKSLSLNCKSWNQKLAGSDYLYVAWFSMFFFTMFTEITHSLQPLNTFKREIGYKKCKPKHPWETSPGWFNPNISVLDNLPLGSSSLSTRDWVNASLNSGFFSPMRCRTKDNYYIRPPKDDIYLDYLKSRKGLFCTNFVRCVQCCQAMNRPSLQILLPFQEFLCHIGFHPHP